MIQEENLINILASSVKPDLNHIYTEPPFQVNGGLDFGWFCREHAMHLSLLAALLGLKEYKIIMGDIVIRNGLQFFTTLNTDADHAWCSISGTTPIDLSLSFRFYKEVPNLTLIFGYERKVSRPYTVYYLSESERPLVKELVKKEEPVIIYLPKEIVYVNADLMVKDPYSFLFQPPPGTPRYTQIHGEDIFNMITMHCYKLVIGKAKPLYKHYGVKESLQRIKKWNPNAKEELYKILRLYSQ